MSSDLVGLDLMMELESKLRHGFDEEDPKTYMFDELRLQYIRWASLDELLTDSDSSIRELVGILMEKFEDELGHDSKAT